MTETFLERRSLAEYAEDFERVHAGTAYGVDFYRETSGQLLDTRFYDAELDETTREDKIIADFVALQRAVGGEIASAWIDRQEVVMRAFLARQVAKQAQSVEEIE